MKQKFTTWRFRGVDRVDVLDPTSLEANGPRYIGKRYDKGTEEYVLDETNGHFVADQRDRARFSHYFADSLNKGELLPADAETARYFGVAAPRAANALKAIDK